uniref:MoaB/Mog domain-containing protein n=1 Tax=Timema cristinae TaxID=61476 RepID=A0A7R9GU90_TIMCR|nr:unnamed protein product [Timema cristinae]
MPDIVTHVLSMASNIQQPCVILTHKLADLEFHQPGRSIGHTVLALGDDEAAIIEEVQVFSQKYTYVITTGGIGPTHDDITFEAVAKAFGESVAPHPELVSMCKMFYKTDDLNSPAMKLACVPKSAKLNFGFDRQGKRTLYPNVSIKNVYIFPGIPQLMEKSFSILSEDLFGAGHCKFFMKELYIKSPEDSIAGPLSSTAKEFPNVTFGSYPELFQRIVEYVLVSLRLKEKVPDRSKDLKLEAILDGSLNDLRKKAIINLWSRNMRTFVVNSDQRHTYRLDMNTWEVIQQNPLNSNQHIGSTCFNKPMKWYERVFKFWM